MSILNQVPAERAKSTENDNNVTKYSFVLNGEISHPKQENITSGILKIAATMAISSTFLAKIRENEVM